MGELRTWFFMLSAVLMCFSCTKKKPELLRFEAGYGGCGNAFLGNYDIVLTASRDSAHLNLTVVTFEIPERMRVRAALVNGSDRNVLDIVDSVIPVPDQVLAKVQILPEEAEYYNLLVIAPDDGSNLGILDQRSGREVVCQLPAQDTTNEFGRQ